VYNLLGEARAARFSVEVGSFSITYLGTSSFLFSSEGFFVFLKKNYHLIKMNKK
jgi:hypothetical protein